MTKFGNGSNPKPRQEKGIKFFGVNSSRKTCDDGIKILRKPIERLKASVSLFINHQIAFELNSKNSKFKDLEKFFTFSPHSDNSFIMNCEGEVNARIVEKMVRWFMNDYKDEALVVRNYHRIIVSSRKSSKTRARRIHPIGCFCLPPSEGADIEELRMRLQKVCNVLGFNLRPGKAGYCIVSFKKLDVVGRVNNLLLQMGWDSSLMDDKFSLLIKI